MPLDRKPVGSDGRSAQHPSTCKLRGQAQDEAKLSIGIDHRSISHLVLSALREQRSRRTWLQGKRHAQENRQH